MGYGKELKRETQLIIISVLILTLVTLRFSYSAFFSVESQSTIQEISTGTLDVIIDNTTSMAVREEALYPTSTSSLPTSENSVAEGGYATLTLLNRGSLIADYSITLGYDTLPIDKTTDDLLSLNYLNIGIYDVNDSKWLDFGGGNYYTQITSLTPSDTNVYPILRNTIEASDPVTGTTTVKQYRIYVWLAEDTPVTEIGKLIYLKIDVKSTTIDGHEE